MIADVAGNFSVIEAPQRSAAWFAARAGRVTGSVAAAMMANGRGKGVESVQRRDLRIRLALERITGQPQEDGDGYVSTAMQHGIDTEAEAVAAYEVLTGTMVSTSGFLSHNVLQAGCSLDGHIREFEGVTEFKCPKAATHLRYLRDKVMPEDYRWQIQHELFITNASYCDFVSYCPSFPPELQLFRVRVSVDAFDMTAYHLALTLFLSEVDKEVTSILALAGAA